MHSTANSSPRQTVRNFESNFLKYLSIFDGVARDTIAENEIELASAVFEDQVKLVPINESSSSSSVATTTTTSTDTTTKTVNMDQLKSMMQRYLQSGTRFELLEVHLLKYGKNQKNSNDLDRDSSHSDGDDGTPSSPSAENGATIRIQYSARMIKANGDSEIGTTRVILSSSSGRIESIVDTPPPSKKRSDEDMPVHNDDETKNEENDCRSQFNSSEFQLVGFGSSSPSSNKGTSSTILLTPVLRSL